MIRATLKCIVAALLLMPLHATAQSSDPLPPETRLIYASGTATPTEDDFTIASAQDLTITLTDQKVPAELRTATVVVSQGDAVVGSATLSAPAATASFKIAKATGDYVLRVFGDPNAAYSVGTFTVCVAPQSSPSNCIQSASIAGNLSRPSTASNPSVSTLSVDLTVATGGSYTVNFGDRAFPVALQTAPNVALFQGSSIVSLGIASGTALNLTPGTYTLLSVAQADATAQAGLYGISITGPATLLSVSVPVGSLAAASQVTNSSAQSLTLKAVDFGFPGALSSVMALVTTGATALGNVTSSSGPSTFAAAAGPLQIWTYAAAGGSAGTYEVDLQSASASLLQAAFGVNSGTAYAYGFVSPQPLAAGSYQVSANDLAFPANLASLQVAAAQGGVLLGQKASSGTLDVTLAAGPVVLLAAASPASSGTGLFDVNVQTSGSSPTLELDEVQPVSAVGGVTTQPITLGVAGNFAVTLTDLALPVKFQTLALVGASKGSVLGKIYGGGTFPLTVTPGNYQFTVVAIPDAQQHYGMYGIEIVNAPPTVTLNASPTSLAAGGATTLSWTTTNATSCTASGGTFSGSEPAGSGSTAVVVSATTTYTLTCTGPGGSASSSATVTATAAPGKSGGGGALGMEMLGLLGALAAARTRRMRSARP
jgi:hypothetical protein